MIKAWQLKQKNLGLELYFHDEIKCLKNNLMLNELELEGAKSDYYQISDVNEMFRWFALNYSGLFWG